MVLAAWLCGVLAAPAHATLMLEVSDGTNTVTASESPGAESISLFNVTLGNWTLNFAGGDTSVHFDGSATSTGAGGSLTIRLTATDFVGGMDVSRYVAGIGGLTNGTVNFQAYLGLNNDPFATDVLLYEISSTDAALGSGVFGASGGGTAYFPDLYSLTLVGTITHSSSSRPQRSSFDAGLKVPEPATLALLGMGLVLVGALRKRKTG